MFSTKFKIQEISEEVEGSGVLKRPFCNAFTGCGRKRMALSPVSLTANEFVLLADATSGPSSELMRLSQQILHEAKLWELMQQQHKMMQMLHSENSGVNPTAEMAIQVS